MKKATIILQVAVMMFILGCASLPKPIRMLWPWEGLPSWTLEQIAMDQAPDLVVKAMRKEYPNSKVDTVERSTFESRLEGYPKQYRFTFAQGSSPTATAVFDETGGRVSDDGWFHMSDRKE